MNPNLCVEYQQLMLRYNEKSKALNVQEKTSETRSKSIKQRHQHEHKDEKTKINKVFENDKIVEKMEETNASIKNDKIVEKMEETNVNIKSKKINNVDKTENKKNLPKILKQIVNNKKIV